MDQLFNTTNSYFNEVSILYTCGCGKQSPLSQLYWSESCNKVVCTATCSVEEIDSYYCPYMLDNMPTQEAALYKNRSSSAFLCPDCNCVLVTSCIKSQYFLVCGYCRWDSLGIHFISDQPDKLINIAMDRDKESSQEKIFKVLSSYYCISASPSISSVTRRSPPTTPWKWEDAENKLEEMYSKLHIMEERPEIISIQLSNIAKNEVLLRTEEESCQVSSLHNIEQVSTLKQRYSELLYQPKYTRNLFPQRLLLRTKRSRRCVEALEKGFPGILVKPQINPLTGDSSMHAVASWWKKANAAIQYLPQLVFSSLPVVLKDSSRYNIEFNLLVINPLDVPIKVSFMNDIQESNGDKKIQLTEEILELEINAKQDPNLIDDDVITKKEEKNHPALIERNMNTVTILLKVFLLDDIENKAVIHMKMKILILGQETNESNLNNATIIRTKFELLKKP